MTHYRWHLCAFIFFATVLNYMNRQTLSIVAPLIQRDFHLDNAQLGVLFSVFYLSYGVSVALVGEVIDRVSVRLGFAAAVAWWSVATALTGLARSFGQLLGFRLALGVGEAGNWPITARLVSMYLAPRERTLANAIYMGGGSLGLAIIGPVLVGLSLRFGWRAGFVVIGALSTVWLVAWWAWCSPARIGALARQDLGQREHAAGGWGAVLRTPRFYGLLLASLCGNTCLYFLMTWLPPYLVQDRGIRFSLKLGAVVIIPFLGLDVGYLVSGFGVIGLGRLGWSVLASRRTVLIGSALLMSVALAATPRVATQAATLALLFAGALGMAGWNSNYLCFVEELNPLKAGAVAGVVGSVGAFAGAVSLWLVGVISTSAGSFAPVFAMMAGLIWIGSAGIVLTREPDRASPPALDAAP